jgi:hypothetical protein
MIASLSYELHNNLRGVGEFFGSIPWWLYVAVAIIVIAVVWVLLDSGRAPRRNR